VASLGPITAARAPTPPGTAGSADLILRNGRIFTGDPARPQAAALAVSAGRITAVGNEADIAALAGPGTRVVDALGRRVIPGLNDSHIHLIRGGVNYLLELRWDGVPALSLALRMLREQAEHTPPGQWVRVVGGWSGAQFAEKRLPTVSGLNAAAPDTPGAGAARGVGGEPGQGGDGVAGTWRGEVLERVKGELACREPRHPSGCGSSPFRLRHPPGAGSAAAIARAGTVSPGGDTLRLARIARKGAVGGD